MLEGASVRGVFFFVEGKFALQATGFLCAERLMLVEVDSFPYISSKGGGKTRARLGLEIIWAGALHCFESIPLPRRAFSILCCPSCIATVAHHHNAKRRRSVPMVQLDGLQIAEEMRGSAWFMEVTVCNVEGCWVVLLPNLTKRSPAHVTSGAPTGPYGRGWLGHSRRRLYKYRYMWSNTAHPETAFINSCQRSAMYEGGST